MKRSKPTAPLTTREHCRRIFGDAAPPREVWEPEFDYADDKLRALAAKDWRQIDAYDLQRYYLLNLVYNEPMQPELFNYLFPLCLAEWQAALIGDDELWGGLGDFYRALRRPYLWQQMMAAHQREQVTDFLVDSMLERLRQERGFVYTGKATPAYTWLYTFNDLGASVPLIETLWTRWWALDHPGLAVSALMYVSGLIYLPDDNPIFKRWTREHGGGGPYLIEIPSMIDDWLPENLNFLRRTLSVDSLIADVQRAADVLHDQPEGPLAARIAIDAGQQREIIEIRIGDLLAGLEKPGSVEWEG